MQRFLKDIRGATAIEYALILAVIVLVLLTGLLVLGGGVGNNWNSTAGKVAGAMK